MGPSPLTLALAIALALSTGPNIAHGSSVEEDTTITIKDTQCSPLQKRQDLLDNRMNERDSRLNALDTRLHAVNIRLNRLDRLSGFDDGIKSELSDVSDYVQKRLKAIGEKVERALRDVNQHQEPTEEPLVLNYQIDDEGMAFADGAPLGGVTIKEWPTTITRNISSLTRLLAFNVTNHGGPTGVMASLSNGVMTDMYPAWKCSKVYEEGWNQIDFDDSHWGRVDYQNSVSSESNDYGIAYGALRIGCGSRAMNTPFYFRRWL